MLQIFQKKFLKLGLKFKFSLHLDLCVLKHIVLSVGGFLYAPNLHLTALDLHLTALAFDCT